MNGIHGAFEGHLAADAELKFSSTGQAVCNFSVAVWDSKKGENADTEWIRCAIWGDEAERLAPSLKKGAEVYCEGRVKLSSWNAADGTPRSGLNATVWTVTLKGAVGRKAPPRRPETGGADEWFGVPRQDRAEVAR